MRYENLINYISTFTIVPERELHQILFLFKPATIKKDAYFLKQGDIQRDIGFINTGLFRYFYIDKGGNEHTKHFVTNNEFVLSLSALISKRPAEFCLLLYARGKARAMATVPGAIGCS